MSLLLVLKSAASGFAGTPAFSGSGTLSTTGLPGLGGLATKNWATNPSSETSSVGTATNGTLTQSTTQAFVGTNSTRMSATATSARGYTGEHVNIGAVAVNDVVTVSIYIYSPIGFTATLNMIGYTSADVSLGAMGTQGSTVVPVNTWTRLTATTTLNAFQVGSDLSKVAPNLNLPAGSIGELFYFDATQVTKNSALGAAIPYFDGSTTDTGTDLYTWDGAAHASTSTWVVGAGVPGALSGDGTLGATGAIPSAGASFIGSNQVEATPVAGNTLLVPYPTSGIQNGDIALFYFSNTVAALPPDHSGWTTIKKGSSVGDTVQPTHYVGWRYCNGTENGTSYTMTTGNNNHIAGISVFRNVDPTALQFTFTEIGSGSTTTMTGITTPTAGSVLFSLVGLNSTAATATFGSTPTAFTEVMDRVSGSRSAAAAYAIWSGSGATGSPVATWSGSARSNGVFVALPVAVPTTGIRPVNFSRTEPTAGGASPVLEVPSGTALNDLMIAEFSYNNNSVMGAQSGWTQLEGASQTSFGVTAFWRFATASEPSTYTFALGFSGRYSAAMAVYRGVDLVTVEDVASSATLGTTSQAAYTATTPVTAGAVVLAIGGHLTGVGEVTPVWSSSNMSVAVQNTSQVAAQAETSAAIAHAPWTSGAFTPNLTSDLTMTRSISITAVLRPAATGTSFSGTATLSGSGDLTSVQIPRPVVTAALSGDGTLSSTQVPRPAVTAALSGDGILTSVQIPRPAQTAALSGSGTLSTTQLPSPARVAALSGSGTLGAAGVAVLTPMVSQAAYRFYADGTESGATNLALKDTPYTAVLTDDLNLAIRMRLQETNGVDVPAGDDWQLQWENNASGTWIDVSPEPARLDNYPVANQDGYNNLTNANAIFGQSFLGDGQKLTTAHFYLLRQGTAVGTLRAVLYAHTGTFGSGGAGTGIPMVTSYGVDAATVQNTAGGGPGWIRFDFPSTFTLSNGVPYVIAIYNDTSGDTSNRIQAGIDTTSSTHAGNQSQNTTGSWVANTTDMIFEVRTAPGTPTSVTAQTSANLTDQAVTGQRLGAGSGTFVPGRVSIDGLANNLSVTQGWTGGNYTEVLYSITLRKYNLASSDILRFRVVDTDATSIQAYPLVPTINVTIGTAFVGVAGLSGEGTLSAAGALPITVIPTDFTNADWTRTGTASATSTRLTLPSSSSSVTTTSYSLDGAQVFWKVAQRLTGGTVLCGWQIDANNYLAFKLGSSITCQLIQNGVPILDNVYSWDPTRTFFQLRELSDEVIFEYSATGAPGTWSIIDSIAAPAYVLNGSPFSFSAGSGTGAAWIENLNQPASVFAGTATLSGSGALTTTQAPAFPVTSVLSGSGTLTTTQVPRPVVTTALSGDGALSTTQTPRPVVTAALSGDGTLSSTQVPRPVVTAALSGSGTLTSVQIPGPAVSAALSGTGTLATVQTPRPAVASALSGTGTLTTTQALTTSGIATLSGSGVLTTVQIPGPVISAALSGSGTLAAVGAAIQAATGTATLSGSGTLTSTGVPGPTVLAVLSGSGTLTAVGVAGPTIIASLSGTGTLATTQVPRPTVTAALSGSGTLTTVITLTTTGIAVLSGSGTLVALRVYDATTIEWGDSATGTGWTNPANAIGPDDATYAFWTSSTASAVSPPLEVGFGDFATVPADASNISVRVRVKGYWS